MARAILQCIRVLLLISAITAGAHSFAQTITEDFLTENRKGSANLIWNTQMGILHAPLTIYDWDYDLALPVPQNRDIDIGTGEHGAFNSTTYSDFDIDGNPSNNVIVINTDSYPNGLNVTDFQLDAGITLSPIGDTPLVIKSFSNIVISGVIDCSGSDGELISATHTVTSAGGQGRCAGGDGGIGGSLSVLPTNGTTASTSSSGGIGGLVGGPSGGIGGGGGGSYNTTGAAGDAGENPNVAGPNDGGAVGTINTSDHGFAELFGGAGGGGGSASTNGTDNSNGGGGGAGGGVIILMAYNNVHIANTGFILANGGAGGGGGASLDGGGGGGGGGGSIALFAGNEVINDEVLGVSADGGAKGVTTNVTNSGSHGGSGVTGRIWMTDADGALTGTGNEPGYANNLISLGNVLSREGTYTAISAAIELFTSVPEITAANLVSQSGGVNTVTVDFASGASSGFDPSGSWIDSTIYVGQIAARFLKFQVTLTVGDHTQISPELDSLSLTYDPLFQTQFDFKSGGCGRVLPRPEEKTHDFASLAILLLPLLTAMILKRKARRHDRSATRHSFG